MAAAKKGEKRKNKRKSRTADVSSDSSSESGVSSGEITSNKDAGESTGGESDSENGGNDTKANSNATTTQQTQPPLRPQDAEAAFESFYLQQVTKEFANDLDKLRSAGDFKDQSVPILIDALKQGTACFNKEERVRYGRAAQ